MLKSRDRSRSRDITRPIIDVLGLCLGVDGSGLCLDAVQGICLSLEGLSWSQEALIIVLRFSVVHKVCAGNAGICDKANKKSFDYASALSFEQPTFELDLLHVCGS